MSFNTAIDVNAMVMALAMSEVAEAYWIQSFVFCFMPQIYILYNMRERTRKAPMHIVMHRGASVAQAVKQ